MSVLRLDAQPTQTAWLDELETQNILTGWGEIQPNKSISGTTLSIGGKKYKRGIGVHAVSFAEIKLDGKVTKFIASVGVDDVMRGKGSVQFFVVADGIPIHQTKTMRGGQVAEEINVNLSGVKTLILRADDAGNGIGQDHANWADARIEYTGSKPKILKRTEVPVLEKPISPTNRSQSPVALIPYPREVQWGSGTVNLFDAIGYQSKQEGSKKSAELLKDYLINQGMTGELKAPFLTAFDMPSAAMHNLKIEIETVSDLKNNPQGYHLQISKAKGVELKSENAAGLFYGIQTLKQLIQKNDKNEFIVPECEITDWPEFKVRGLMHDVGRNFQSIDYLKKQVDLLAAYKYNVFHWHLTDYPGYRIESKKYPQLNDPKNYRQSRDPGKFYTFDEINDFVEYCKQRHIEVIPEIDVPGHSEYFHKTFGFDMQHDKGTKIVHNLLNEFCDNVDLPKIHIGSDEVKIKNRNFIPDVVKLLKNRGKEVIIWRPGGAPTDNTIITQLWTGAAKGLKGNRAIDSQATYINHMDPFDGILRIFMMQPCRNIPDPKNNALGGILCHWPDNNVDSQELLMKQSPVVPAIVAYSERIWRGSLNDQPEYYARMPQQSTAAFKEFAEFEKDFIQHRDKLNKDWYFPYIEQTNFKWKLLGPIDHKGDFSKAFGPESEIKKSYTIDGNEYSWSDKEAIGGSIHMNHFFGWQGHIPKTKQGTVYAKTTIHSDRTQEVDFWIQFGTPSTSSRRNGGNPPEGKWSSFDSKIWINGNEIQPPKWNNPGPLGSRSREKEIVFTNEAYHYREPIKIKLKKGDNNILLRVPFGNAKGYKGGKWMFTCVPILLEKERVYSAPNLNLKF